MKTASWVIRHKQAGTVVFETFSATIVAALNTAKYEAAPILEYLQSVNRAARESTQAEIDAVLAGTRRR